jgi:ssDNA thymidine ADP-ribosyltransferase DarT-like protein
MTRNELNELGYIVPIATVPSILRRGILSHRRAEKVDHESIALRGVQDRRATKMVPGGRALHEYANLYICPRNPMLLKKREIHEQICVLRVSTEVLDIRNVVITDSNAASKYVSFKAPPDGLAIVDRNRTFAEWWTHDDQIEQWRHSAQKCAEVLVPDAVQPQYIRGAYVSCIGSRDRLLEVAPNLPTTVDPFLFFQ